MMTATIESVLEELRALRAEVAELREAIIEDPPWLTPAEHEAWIEARGEYERGETITLEEFKRKLGE